MRTPPRNPAPRTGELRCCARTWPTDPPCPLPATWHIAWVFTPSGHFSLACDTHMSELASVYDYVDRHPAETNCDMPGTGWLTPAPSQCVIAPTVEVEGASTRESEQP